MRKPLWMARRLHPIMGTLAFLLTGFSGFRLAGTAQEPTIRKKKRRMPLIAANGLLVLAPAAGSLASLASRGNLGGAFHAIQAVELVAGGINLSLMFLDLRDGLRVTGRLS